MDLFASPSLRDGLSCSKCNNSSFLRSSIIKVRFYFSLFHVSNLLSGFPSLICVHIYTRQLIFRWLRMQAIKVCLLFLPPAFKDSPINSRSITVDFEDGSLLRNGLQCLSIVVIYKFA